ncbi:lectin [Pelomonas cellulosilytica]|uniref:Lectin n=1 Tax=Pelomonas cellulosilytica TaxID=2906762 RepID=A0ABS8XQ82_9BURK|nr:lectin [Pelomonas sp. P8]MCE4553988.1 lectin [Pelomonas sp. P8]
MKNSLVSAALLLAFGAQAQTAPTGAASAPPPPPFTFFVTSVGGGNGANYGGLAGADAHCQKLADAAGTPYKTWRAYLSTQGAGGVNARDRIGRGPWTNVRGQVIARDVAHLHGDTLELAQLGSNLTRNTALTEKGERPKAAGDTPNEHDILTGSAPDGRAFPDGADKTCSNYTSGAEDGAVQLGHFDRTGGGNASWNSAHPSRGCSQPKLVSTGGAGLLYCFVAN